MVPIDGPLRVAVDSTPLIGRRTGVGVFTAEVLDGLDARPDVTAVRYDLVLRSPVKVPKGITRRLVSAPPVRRALERWRLRPIEARTGPVEVVHGTNYVVPPTRAAAVSTVHDLTAVHYPELCTEESRRFPDLVKAAIDRGAWVHTVSAFVADEVIEHLGADPDRVRVVGNGVRRATPGDPGRGSALAGADCYVLTMATVEPRKDHPGLVRAFATVAREVQAVRLVLAGPDGWGTEALEEALARSPVADRVTRLGWVSDEDRADLLAGAAVLAYPSRYEGFGLPPLEAMAAGVPVVATAVGGVTEVAGDAAVLVPQGDEEALAAALVEVMTDDDLAERLRVRGRARVDHYRWDATVDGLVAVYQEAAAAR